MINQGPKGKDIYIFKAMTQAEGHTILENHLATLNHNVLKENGYALWLVREKAEGKLTVDFIFWDKDSDTWEKASMRIVLTDKGWMSEKALKESDQLLTRFTADTANNHKNSLEKCILSVPGLLLEHRVNPVQTMQSIYDGFSSYHQANESKKTPRPR
jgi:hypothetical protein